MVRYASWAIAQAGLTLTNPSGAAINVQNGKRIDISVKKDTKNTLTWRWRQVVVSFQ